MPKIELSNDEFITILTALDCWARTWENAKCPVCAEPYRQMSKSLYERFSIARAKEERR